MPHFLQAGSLNVRYENGFLRYLTAGDSEILRLIYVAIRDRNWQTTSLTIDHEEIEQHPDSFRIRYDWQTNELGIQMTGQVAIQGDTDGTITVNFSGKAVNDFLKNRIGLCVLHPTEGVLGQPAEVISADDELTSGHFPTFIQPTPPFLNIQTFRWLTASGSVWQLDFSGDVFEMEDQRNWTDDSFKTYSTPASLPAPVAVSAGDEFRQQVVFRPSKQALTNEPTAADTRSWQQAQEASHPVALRIGVGQRTGGPSLTTDEAALLRKLDLSHLRADVFFSLPDWAQLLNQAIADADALAIPLELAVFFGDEPLTELAELENILQARNVLVGSLLLFDAATLTTSDTLVNTVLPGLRERWPVLKIGGGTDGHFADLNQHRFTVEPVDFITYSVTPQAHATDELTIRENSAGLRPTVLTARQFADNKPVHISPVCFKPRNITTIQAATERLNTPVDPRQNTSLGADWTLQCLQALAQAGVESVTIYQSHGPAGLVDGQTIHPAYEVIRTFK